jgi:hypothetical protein
LFKDIPGSLFLGDQDMLDFSLGRFHIGVLMGLIIGLQVAFGDIDLGREFMTHELLRQYPAGHVVQYAFDLVLFGQFLFQGLSIEDLLSEP